MEEVLQRIQNVLAMILLHDMKDAQQAEKASALHRAGLPNGDIATLLGTTSGVIAQQLYASRANKRRKPAARGAKRAKK